MRGLTLLSTVFLSVTLSMARAQHRQEATYFLRHAASSPVYARQLLPAGPALPAGAPRPLVWAASAPTAQSAAGPMGQLPLATSLPTTPRRDATGVQPLYDLYGRLPEDFRKHTLPAVYTEPLPVQLLRGFLGQ